MSAQMARLNEPAVPTETIDSLKRKFMRQNRDIARANSAQSLRIRNLENETSRLLAENLGLREQILRLQNELENGQSKRVADHTADVKSQLEAKLLELGALITGLGDDPKQKKKSPKSGQLTRESPSRSPVQKNWKNMCTLSEAVAGQEGRLPPILENKTYPRKTLEPQEILDIVADASGDTTDSPEIGPPPVSQFVDEDPVKIDLPKRKQKEDSEELDPALSINLEQRRKRKDSVGASESKQFARPKPVQGTRDNPSSLKIGAKRKFSVRGEEEDREAASKPTESSPDDFKFTRVTSEERTKNKAAPPPEKTATRTTRELAIARGAPRENKSSMSAPTARKVLAPKSANDSPKKFAKVLIQDEAKPLKSDFPKQIAAKERRGKKDDPVQINPPIVPPVDIVDVPPEPETPAGLDIFSPSSSQPSTARAESRDTPPPPDLGLGTEGQRPSRRARGAVSYAEPNLRDKMRRPTKELIDAVSRDDKAHRGSSVKLEEDASSTVVKIKAEPEADDAWKQMPVASSATVENSPLRGKAPATTTAPDTLPSSITTHRRRRESLLHQAEVEGARSGSSAIAVLLAETRKAKAAAREKEKVASNEAAVTTAMSKLDIYEFRGSSPHPQEETSTKEIKEEKGQSRLSRRHSTVPRDNPSIDEGEISDIEALTKPDLPVSRRRQSALGLRSSSASSGSSRDEGAEKILKRSASTTGMGDSGAGSPRSDRISARRRSMML